MILFAAIDIPDKIAKDIARVQRGVSGARWRSRDQLHITVGYFGDIHDDSAEMLDDELARKPLPGFELTLSGGGHFGREEIHSIWTGIDDALPLTALHKHCRRAARAAGIIMEARKFIPHVTLAYMKPESPIDRIVAFEKNMSAFRSGPFWVDSFHLYSSHRKKTGSNLYRLEASYPLIAPPQALS